MSFKDNGWAVLFVAGLMEVVWAVAMGYSDGFTKIPFDIIVVVFLSLSIFLLSKALKMGIPVGTGYAVWTGIGAIGTITVSLITGAETATALKMVFVAMIIAGIIGLQLTSGESKE